MYAYVDIEAMRKIFNNLFSNAIKYAATEIQIYLYSKDEHFCIEVSNDGLVIPYNLKDKIFEPFYRINSQDNSKGTGIGLSIARSLVELHRGKLYLTLSESNLNTFVLEIPKNR